jgi:hypothetical protein
MADGELTVGRNCGPSDLMIGEQQGTRATVPRSGVVLDFQIAEGDLVEIWNHRHDIDVGYAANILRVQGFAAGVLSAMVAAFGIRIWRRRRRRRTSSPIGAA